MEQYYEHQAGRYAPELWIAEGKTQAVESLYRESSSGNLGNIFCDSQNLLQVNAGSRTLPVKFDVLTRRSSQLGRRPFRDGSQPEIFNGFSSTLAALGRKPETNTQNV
ncbi:hypothetical protein TNCV_1692461 [Trichonephila clavipes]|nr:hypothetical protein TNCV_1692461 [Trichonephila clavipes]